MSTDIPFPADPVPLPDTRHGLHLFADGCFEPGAGYGGWAFIAYRDGVEIATDFGGIADTNNNAMELTALLHAAVWVSDHAKDEPAVIWSDSVYAVKGSNHWRPIWKNNGWKKISANTRVRARTIANAKLWKAVDHALSKTGGITIAWCKGHAGIAGNEEADSRADQGRLLMEKRRA